ncbi:MAG: T9SS type A sorting domain-containing protein [Saprospiraceae bacterium]
MKFNGIESGALVNFDESNIGLSKLNNGEIAISWNKVTNLNLDANTALFTLKFISSNPVNLKDVLSITSSQIKKEAYNEELEVMDVNLNYRNAEGNVFALYQNTPNPFSDYTNINFNLPENSHALLTIMDLTGKVVYSREGDFTKGMNTVKIEKSDLNASGVLMYKLETSDNIDTKKMIMIK